MQYIDLDNGIFTDPETETTSPCKIAGDEGSTTCFLSIAKFFNDTPFLLLGMNTKQRLEWLYKHGLHPVDNDCGFPEFKHVADVKKTCMLLNEALNEKYSSMRSSISYDVIKLDFD